MNVKTMLMALLMALGAISPVAAQVHETPFSASFEASLSQRVLIYRFDFQSLMGDDARAVGEFRAYVAGEQVALEAFDTRDFEGIVRKHHTGRVIATPGLEVCAVVNVEQAVVINRRLPRLEGIFVHCLLLTPEARPDRSQPNYDDCQSNGGGVWGSVDSCLSHCDAVFDACTFDPF